MDGQWVRDSYLEHAADASCATSVARTAPEVSQKPHRHLLRTKVLVVGACFLEVPTSSPDLQDGRTRCVELWTRYHRGPWNHVEVDFEWLLELYQHGEQLYPGNVNDELCALSDAQAVGNL